MHQYSTHSAVLMVLAELDDRQCSDLPPPAMWNVQCNKNMYNKTVHNCNQLLTDKKQLHITGYPITDNTINDRVHMMLKY